MSHCPSRFPAPASAFLLTPLRATRHGSYGPGTRRLCGACRMSPGRLPGGGGVLWALMVRQALEKQREGHPGAGPAGAERWRRWGPGRPCRARGLFRVDGARPGRERLPARDRRRCGRCCPWACMYLQSEAETLQLAGARVWEPWLLTARPGARPVRRQPAAAGGAPSEPGARGRLCLGPGGRPRGPGGHSDTPSGTQRGTRTLTMAPEHRRARAHRDSLPDLQGTEPGLREAHSLTTARRQSRLAPGSAGVLAAVQGSLAHCSPCVSSDFSQAQSLLNEVEP